MQEFPQLLIFTLEELKQYRKDNYWSYKVLSSENFEASDHCKSGFWMQY
jgi:hypothetical protein